MNATKASNAGPAIEALDQKRAAAHLRGLLRDAEGSPAVRRRSSPMRRLVIRIVCGIAVVAICLVALQRAIEFMEAQERIRTEQARLRVEQERMKIEQAERQKRIKQADLTSWDLAARVLLDSEVMPDESRPGQSILRTPEQVLKLDQSFLARRSGSGWQDVSPPQSENIRTIAATFVSGLTALHRMPALEALLYCRSAVSLSSNSSAVEASVRLSVASETAAAFAKMQTAWAPTPKDAPQDHITQMNNLTRSRAKALDAEIALLRYLVDNPREWTLPARGDVHIPIFSKAPLQAHFKQLLETESSEGAALLQNLSQLVGPTLARQLKGLR